MNNQFIIRYRLGDSYMERLHGFSKFALAITSIVVMMIGFDLRLILPYFVLNFLILAKNYKKGLGLPYVIGLTLFFNVVNVLLFYLYNPLIGNELVTQKTVLFQFNSFYVVTYETLIYFLARILKLITTLFVSLWFLLTITPSQFALALYKMGVPYKVCTMLSLGLRYIPDVYRNFVSIRNSMQSRGVELSKKASLMKRIKGNINILLPLILISFEKVDIIASAMDLRGYGENKKRSYYIDEPFTKHDYFVIGLATINLLVIAVYGYLTVNKLVPLLWLP